MGRTFDIHGGGLDLVFPHHENEIAQSECCHGQPMAKYWLHNGLMQASDEVGKVGGRHTRPAEGDLDAQQAGKISKSKGSSAFRELLDQFSPETIRFFLLATHYRRPIDYSDQRIREVETGLETFYRFFKRYERVSGEGFYAILPAARRDEGDFDPAGDPLLADVAERRSRFLEAMDDDFNTGGAIGDLFELVRRLNKFVDDEKLEEPNEPRRRPRSLRCAAGRPCCASWRPRWGCSASPPRRKPAAGDALADKLMKLLIDLRAEARKKKDFATADRIRNSPGGDGRDAGGPARRHGVEPKMKRRKAEGGRRKDEAHGGRLPRLHPCLPPSALRLPPFASSASTRA